MDNKQSEIDQALSHGVMVTCFGDRVRRSKTAKYRLKVVAPEGEYPANCGDIERMVIQQKIN